MPAIIEPADAYTKTASASDSEYLPQDGDATTGDNGEAPRKLTLRRPNEILALPRRLDANVIGDNLLTIGGKLAVVGPGGIGKSRWSSQMTVSCITGRDITGIETRAKGKRWLVLQTENSNLRLQNDLPALRRWVGESDWELVNDCLFIHTLETDWDSMVMLSNPDNRKRIAEAIEEVSPEFVLFDPLKDFAPGNLNDDMVMQDATTTIGALVRRGNPDRAPVVIHHSQTGKAAAGRAVGWEKASYGRNSKVLHSWARGQINIAPGAPDNSVLVFACGKNNDGKEFSDFAVRLNPETMIYEPDHSFDMEAWHEEVSGQKQKGDGMPPERVRELCRGVMTKPELAGAIMKASGRSRATAYRDIDRAAGKTIRWNAIHEHYVIK